MVCGLRDHSPLYVNLYVLGYEYCPCHYPPLHFYYCQIDKILTEEWVMTYIPAVCNQRETEGKKYIRRTALDTVWTVPGFVHLMTDGEMWVCDRIVSDVKY